MNAIFDTVAPALVDLGLLSDEDYTTANTLVTEATKYSALAYNASQTVTRKTIEATDKLLADPKVSPEKILAAATSIPDAQVITSMAETVERSLLRQARELVMARSGEVVPLLNTRLVEIADETATLADELRNVGTPQQAIDAGKVDEWRRAQTLIGDYNVIAELIRELRELKVIPRPTSSTTGAHWRFLRDEDTTTWLPKDPTAWQVHVRSMSRRPWVPASVEQAKAVAADWADAGVPA